MALSPAPFDSVLAALEAAGESTRLRLLALLHESELTVSEIVSVLGQSQPRVSRHLKLLVDAGLVERHREGAWAFFSCAARTPIANWARDLVARLDANDAVLAADRARLADVQAARRENAERYFALQAEQWDNLRSLHVAEERVEAAVLDAVGPGPFRCLVDLGTGTGRMLELLSPRADRAIGIDGSPAMLNVARSRIARSGVRNVQLRQGDIYALPLPRDGADLVVLHQVLHFLDDPARALRESARILRPGGRLVVVDFAPHTEETLRDNHAHRRLGFSREEIEAALAASGLAIEGHRDLGPRAGEADKLTVSIWVGRDRRVLSDAPAYAHQEVA